MPGYDTTFNPFKSTRLGSILAKAPTPGATYKQGMGSGGFNPMLDTSSSPFQQGGLENQKRLFSGIVPQQKYEPPKSNVSGAFQDSSGSDMDSFFNRLQSFNSPENRPARTEYQDALRDAPQYKDYKRGGWGAAGAAIAGAAAGLSAGPGAGVATAQNFLDAPYHRALDDYQTRMQGLESSAMMESQDAETSAQNLGTAATFSMAQANRRDNNRFKGQEQDLKLQELNQNYAKVQAEIQHMRDQDRNGSRKNEIDAYAAQEAAFHNEALEGIGRTNASANMLGSQAQMKAAERPLAQNNSGGMDYDKAYQQALMQMMQSGIPGITVNQGEFGPVYNIQPGYGKSLVERAEQKAILIMNIGKRGGGSGGPLALEGGLPRYSFGNVFNPTDPATMK